MKRILIIGGYGTFGGRLAQLLAPDDRLTLIIVGRSKEKAEAFCRQLTGAAEKVSAQFDREKPLGDQIKALSPDIIVDATGPFQDYGNDPYRVVKAAIACGINYIDLADGTEFVKNITRFDEQAKKKGVFILAGASSFPVLTAAVIRRLAQGLSAVESVTAGIAPSPYAGVGLNVIRAISSYAGQPVLLTRNGKKAIGQGFIETQRVTIAPPGKLPLHSTLFSLVDVPDLEVLPKLWPEMQNIWMGAGPVPEILHRMLIALCWLVRFRVLKSLEPFAELFSFVINHVRWGEHRGGMFVTVEGTTLDGRKAKRAWHLLAEGNDGPLIPSMAVAAIAGHCLAGNGPQPGARAATGDLELTDYDALFASRTITTGFWQTPQNELPLYRKLLGDAWDGLPEAIRDMHDLTADFSAEGRADIDCGSSTIAGFVCSIMKFPAAGHDIPVTVTFAKRGESELWERNFAGSKFHSYQTAGKGHFERLLCERFGLLNFGLALVIEEQKLRLVARRWSILGIPLPTFLMPRGDAYEIVEDGKFHFHVEIKLPFVGLIVRYRGWLVPKK